MRLFTYVLDHDFGFAPNPFHGLCTLATCKPKIRSTAAAGDVIVGTGCARRSRAGYLVYYMIVKETCTFEEYWNDSRFRMKRPSMRGSIMQAVGDNIYHREGTASWVQENSVHSLSDGTPNPKNIEHDTRTNRVLVSEDFGYWGGEGPKLPERLRNFDGADAVAKRAHRSNFSPAHIEAMVGWLRTLGAGGEHGKPTDWDRVPRGAASSRA